jgi:hypothetical protein
MKALVYHGRGEIRCDTILDSKIEDGRDAIIKVTACAYSERSRTRSTL